MSDITGPDLTIFHVTHRGMRTDSRRLAVALASLDERSAPRQVEAMVRWFDGFLHYLQHHHQLEDTLFWPALLERVPEAASDVARLEAEHHDLDEALAGVADSLATLRSARLPFDVARSTALRAANRLVDVLHGHLAFEEGEVLPLFLDYFSATEYQEVEKGVRQPSPKTLAFVLPWIVQHTTEDERGHLFAQAGAPMRILWRLTRGRFARLDAAAFAGARVELLAGV